MSSISDLLKAKNKVAMSFETLIQNVLYPERNNDEYAQLEYNYNVINQTEWQTVVWL